MHNKLYHGERSAFKQKIYIINILIFIVIIFSSHAYKGVNSKTFDVNPEKRELSKKPSLYINDRLNYNFPRQYEQYYNDNVHTREIFIRLNSFVKYKLFNASITPKVIIGKNNWLFYKDTLDDFTHSNLLKQEELERIKDNLEIQKKWLKKQGIEFVVMVAPNKNSIYSEYMSAKYNVINNNSRLDQFIAYMLKHSDIKLVDVRGEMLQKKKTNTLYYKTDTHWNDVGAFIGYKKLMGVVGEIFGMIKPYDFKDYSIKKATDYSGDLAEMMSLKGVIKESNFVMKKNNREEYKYLTASKEKNIIVTEISNSKFPKAVMFRDSFSIRMIPFISNHFSRIVYDWGSYFDAELIKAEKPDIVIREVVERSFKEAFDYKIEAIQESEQSDLKINEDKENKNVRYNLENISQDANSINIKGWAFLEKEKVAGSKFFVILKKDKEAKLYTTANMKRPDVTAYFKSKINYDDSGFVLNLNKNQLQKGQYQIGIYIKTASDEAYIMTSEFLNLQ